MNTRKIVKMLIKIIGFIVVISSIVDIIDVFVASYLFDCYNQLQVLESTIIFIITTILGIVLIKVSKSLWKNEVKNENQKRMV